MKTEKKRCILPYCDISRPFFCAEEEGNEKKRKNEFYIATVRNRFYDTFEEAVADFVRECRLSGRKLRYLVDYTAEEEKNDCKLIFRLTVKEAGCATKTAETIHVWREEVLLPEACLL